MCMGIVRSKAGVKAWPQESQLGYDTYRHWWAISSSFIPKPKK